MSYPPNNLTQPYIANEIGNYFDDPKNTNETARLLAHAALGAASAYISGNSATSGALGAASGEAIAILVRKELYGDKSSSQLTQQEKETIRAVATLASGLVGAMSGGSFEDSATAAAAGYNAAVNNAMLYRKNGKFIGWDGKNDNDIYVTNNKTNVEKNNDKTVDLPEDITKLPVSNSAFEKISGVIKKEGETNDPNEYIDIAHASKNASDEKNRSLFSLLMSPFSSVPNKTPLNSSDNSIIANYARAGVIDALINPYDPTFGATLWDGSDFLAWGTGVTPYDTIGHAKFRQYNSIEIDQQIFNSYLNSQPNSLKYGDTRYQIPQQVFTNQNNWINGNFYYDTGIDTKYGIEATTTAGKTIFWRKVK